MRTPQAPHAPQAQGIIFDLDNTLIDRSRAWTSWLLTLLEGWPQARFEPSMIQAASAQDALGYAPREQVCQWLARALGRPRDGAWIWERMRQELSDHVQPEAQVQAMLKQLSQRYTLAILSNGSSDNQRAKLRAAQLDGLVRPELIFISQELGQAKPEPAAFLAVAQAMALAPEQLWMVGDHPEHDIQGAMQVGMRTAWIAMGRAWPEEAPRPTMILERALQLTAKLERQEEGDDDP